MAIVFMTISTQYYAVYFVIILDEDDPWHFNIMTDISQIHVEYKAINQSYTMNGRFIQCGEITI